MQLFNMESHWDKPILQLSNGENKRLQMVKALLKHPDFLIFDNPFLGLDTEGRKLLNAALGVIQQQGVPFLLINSPIEMPEMISHVMILQNGQLAWSGPVANYEAEHFTLQTFEGFEQKLDELIQTRTAFDPFVQAVKMEDVQIKYGSRTILSHQHWEINKGEAWALKGPNGAGKSTMISMITADNPQS